MCLVIDYGLHSRLNTDIGIYIYIYKQHQTSDLLSKDFVHIMSSLSIALCYGRLRKAASPIGYMLSTELSCHCLLFYENFSVHVLLAHVWEICVASLRDSFCGVLCRPVGAMLVCHGSICNYMYPLLGGPSQLLAFCFPKNAEMHCKGQCCNQPQDTSKHACE